MPDAARQVSTQQIDVSVPVRSSCKLRRADGKKKRPKGRGVYYLRGLKEETKKEEWCC